MTATCRWCGTEVVPDGAGNDVDLMRKMDAHRCPLGVQAWLCIPWAAANCEDCGHVWPTGLHLTEGLAHLEDCPAQDPTARAAEHAAWLAEVAATPPAVPDRAAERF